ncbi:MAG: 30S ribosomal protein S3 [Patescibacteria group bacterium]|nr:30S ribosomal protein S3 [Patescibacteria group bacterium]
MGQKVNPIAFRLGLNTKWASRWFEGSDKKYKEFLHQDLKLRGMVMRKLRNAGVSKVVIERSINKLSVTVHVSRPGMVIGRAGTGLEELRKSLEALAGQPVKLNVEEIKKPELDAYLVGRSVADQIEKRMSVRRILAQTVDKVMTAGAKGVKIIVSGRINGAEIARHEKNVAGTIPLHTLRADIDFAAVDAKTATAGVVGVKVWICKNEVK